MLDIKRRIPIEVLWALALGGFKLGYIVLSVSFLCGNLPYFYIAVRLCALVLTVRLVGSDTVEEYKLPWCLMLLALPTVGLVLYAELYFNRPSLCALRRMKALDGCGNRRCNIGHVPPSFGEKAAKQASLVCELTGSSVYCDTGISYFASGADALCGYLRDIKGAKRYIYLEYYIIAEGTLWQSILAALTERALCGVDVRIIYDDLGCVGRLAPSFAGELRAKGISAVPFSRLTGSISGGLNNRTHRKITVIDGEIAYTGGVNIADEYIGLDRRLGEWKDACIRIKGDAALELAWLFITDYCLSAPRGEELPDITRIAGGVKEWDSVDSQSRPVRLSDAIKPRNYTESLPSPVTSDPNGQGDNNSSLGYVIPFGDGPMPFYGERVGRRLISMLISSAEKSVFITTPYLIVDKELLSVIEAAAERGVRVRIVLPSVPDKPLIYLVSKSYLKRLGASGVEVYLFSKGFIHSKIYLADGKYALVGTMNLDFRSLYHNYECGVWMYACPCLEELIEDSKRTLAASKPLDLESLRRTPIERIFCTVARLFAPLL